MTSVKSRFINIITNIKNHYKKIRSEKNVLYRIVNDNLENDKIVFLCNHLRTTFSWTLHEAVSNIDLINGLSSEEACYLGIRYGRLLRNVMDEKKKPVKKSI